MKPNEVRAYLARWIMEFGTGPVTWDERADNPWYENELHEGVAIDYEDVRPFITMDYGDEDSAWINEAGLNYLKGDDDDPRADTPAG